MSRKCMSAIVQAFTSSFTFAMLAAMCLAAGCTGVNSPGGSGSRADASSDDGAADDDGLGTDGATDGDGSGDAADGTQGGDNGTDGGADSDAGGAGAAEPESVAIAFSEDGSDPLFARALTNDGRQIAVFVERDADGKAVAIQQLTTRFVDGVTVTASIDANGRPSRFEEGNTSATIRYEASQATVVFVDASGEITETVVPLSSSSAAAQKASPTLQALNSDLLCGTLLANYASVAPVLFDCSDAGDEPWCGTAIANAAFSNLALCSTNANEVASDELETEIDTEPAVLPLSAVAFSSLEDSESPNTLSLEVVISGGAQPYTVTWRIIDGPTQPTIAAGQSTQITLDESGVYEIEVTVIDGNDESASDTIFVDVKIQEILSAAAGQDLTVVAGQDVTLQGSASGGSGDYSFAWSPVDGLSDPNAAQPTLTLDEAGTFIYTLTVVDEDGNVATSSINVTVVAEITADAGSNLVAVVNEAVVLEGTATGGSGELTFEWSPSTGLSDANAAQPTLTVAAAGTYTYTLTVTDEMGNEATDSISVVAVASALTAEAGANQSTTYGQMLSLNGSATGGDGAYIYAWSPATGLSNPTVKNPTLDTINVGTGEFEYTLSVTDGTGVIVSDSLKVTINAGGGGQPPLNTINSVKWGANYTGSGSQVVVEFSQPMSQSSAETLTSYRINGTATNPTSASLGGASNTVTLVFAVPLATTNTLDVSVGGAIVDALGRPLAQTLAKPIAANAADTTAPTVSSISKAANFAGPGYRMTVVFNETMDRTTAETLANYRINGTAVNPSTASLGNDGKTVTLTFTTLPLDTADTLDVSVGAAITDINAQAKTQALAQAITANAGDATAPTIASITNAANFAGPGYQMTVVFSEAMDETTAETLANYRINGTAVNPTSASLGNDGTTVTLTFTTLALDTANTLDVSVGTSITDINAQATTQALAGAITANAETTNPSVVSATETAVNQVTVVFDEAMDETTANTTGNYPWNMTITTTNAALQVDGITVILTTSADPSTFLLTVTTGTVADINAQTNNAFTSGAFP